MGGNGLTEIGLNSDDIRNAPIRNPREIESHSTELSSMSFFSGAPNRSRPIGHLKSSRLQEEHPGRVLQDTNLNFSPRVASGLIARGKVLENVPIRNPLVEPFGHELVCSIRFH